MRRIVSLFAVAWIVAGCTESTSLDDSSPATAATGGAIGAAASSTFRVALVAAEEVPASSSDAYGFAWITLNGNNTVEVAVRIWNPGCETFVAGHIHLAPPGAPGSVVVPLFSGSVKQKTETLRGRVLGDPAVVQAILADPGAYYVNYHSVEHPSGAVRGQLSATPDELDPPTVTGRC